MVQSFADTGDSLAFTAEQRAVALEIQSVDYEIRETLFKTRKGKPYRILFTVQGDEVLVLRVRGPGQNYVAAHELPDDPLNE